MWQRLSWTLLQPIVMKAVRIAVGQVDNLIDTPEERIALAEKLLTERHDQIRDALVKTLEKGHRALESKGF